VVRVLLEGGPTTVPALAEALGLTQMGVRRQLDSLVAAGLVVGSERAPYGPSAPRGRGRPAKVFSLTQAGREAIGLNYDDLAAQALRFLAETAGEDAVAAFAKQRAEQLLAETCLSGELSPRDRASALADALTGEGFAANIVDVPGGQAVQLCQHQCPVGHVAAEFPQLCEAEAEVFSSVLGRHVTRLATLAHGDGVCTTLVPVDLARTVPVGRGAHKESERTSS
jgi:predicted ArsR family transcriptional regulator